MSEDRPSRIDLGPGTPPSRRAGRLLPALPALGALFVAAVLVALAVREWRERSGPASDRPAGDVEVLEAIAADLPERDLVALAARFGRIEPEAVEAARTLVEPRPAEAVGDVERFFVHDINGQRYLEIDAELELVTDVAAFWVQRGLPFDEQGLRSGAERFSEDVYPTLREAFGSEWSPGVDHDPRIHILHHEPVLGIAGFFSSSDEMSPAVDPYSNAREMFYINLSVFRPGTDDYLALLAHEFQHMIHWNHDRGEPTWVNEGLSELAPHLVGFGAQHGGALLNQPDVQLTGWKPTAQANSAQYAAAYLFVAYLHDRYGDRILREIVAAPGNGANGIEEAVAAVSAVPAGAGGAPSFETLFLDWTVANALSRSPESEAEAGGPEAAWTYRRDLPRVVQPRPLDERGGGDSVNQFGADYWDVTHHARDGRLSLLFQGTSSVGLLEPTATDSMPGTDGAYPGLDTGGAYPGLGTDDAYPGLDVAPGAGSPAPAPYPPPAGDGSGDGGSGDASDDGDVAGDSGGGGGGAAESGALADRGRAPIWWSGQADGMHTRLEREIDLTGASGGHLDLRMWYELEANWDYAYYTASIDGGRTWRTLPSLLTTDENPNGNNLGTGLTGASGGWVRDRVELDELAGHAALLSIDVITDDAVSLAGVAVDDLRVVVETAGEEGGEATGDTGSDGGGEGASGVDDREESAAAVRGGDGGDGAEGWTPYGWIEVDPRLPQRWGLQLIVDRGRVDPPDRADAIRVLRFDAAPDGSARIETADVPPDATLTLVISGLTSATRNVARYQLSASEAARSSSEPSPSP